MAGKSMILAAVSAGFVFWSSTAWAGPGMPSEDDRDTLIVTTLLRFNDANRTGNYSVLRDLSSRQFQDKNSVRDVADAFKSFRDRSLKLDEVAIREIQPDDGGEIYGDGFLRLSGHVELSRYRLAYVLRFKWEQDDWRMQEITVDLK